MDDVVRAFLENEQKFRLVKRLGRGGFGEVWEVETSSGIRSAIKASLDPIDGESPAVKKELDSLNFVKEFSGHPHIVSLLDYWLVSGYLVTRWELATEGDLLQVLSEYQRQGEQGIPLNKLIKWMYEAADGLDFLHEKGIYHRDIKPQNLLLFHGHVKIGDLGLAKLVGASTASHTGSGTFGYLPPEAWEEHRLTPSVDLYSLAATYIKLRTGKEPFGTNPVEIVERQKRGEPIMDGLSEAEKSLLLQALHFDPEKRCVQGARAWLRQLYGAMKPKKKERVSHSSGLGVRERVVETVVVADVVPDNEMKSVDEPRDLPVPQPRSLAPRDILQIAPDQATSDHTIHQKWESPSFWITFLLTVIVFLIWVGTGIAICFLPFLVSAVVTVLLILDVPPVSAAVVGIDAWLTNTPFFSHGMDTSAGDTTPATEKVQPSSRGNETNGDLRQTGHAVNFQELIARCPEGGTIRLGEGVFELEKPLEITKSMSLVGAGMDRTRVVCKGEGFVVKFSGPSRFTALGISFEHYGDKWANVVEVESGTVQIENCRFRGGKRDEENKRGGAGLWLHGAATGQVKGSHFVRNELHGIKVTDIADPQLEGNTCEGNQQSGIAYFGSAGGTARNNVCQNNGYDGVGVNGQAAPTLEGNTCEGNQASGIVYSADAGGTARKNVCRNNANGGIVLQGQAAPTLEYNTCEGNGDWGIAYFQNAGGTARNNVCRTNKGHQIFVTENAKPVLLHNEGEVTTN